MVGWVIIIKQYRLGGLNNKNLLIVKGDIETVCKKCTYAEYRGEVYPMDIQSVHHIIDEMQEDGMKVIAVAYKNINKTLTLIITS